MHLRFADWLDRAGHEVISFVDAPQFLGWSERPGARVDLVVLALSQEQRLQAELVATIADAVRHTPMVVLAQGGVHLAAEQLKRHQVVGCLEKPARTGTFETSLMGWGDEAAPSADWVTLLRRLDGFLHCPAGAAETPWPHLEAGCQ